MTFVDIPSGADVFLDANTLISYFIADPKVGPACKSLLERIENQDIQGFTSVHVLGETTHRLMTFEACLLFGWPHKGIAQRLQSHPIELRQLAKYRQAFDEIPLFPIQVLTMHSRNLSRAIDVTRQHGLLINDALVVSTMEDHNLSHLASGDGDFDRVSGLHRYSPI